jgi:hypothetical protein
MHGIVLCGLSSLGESAKTISREFILVGREKFRGEFLLEVSPGIGRGWLSGSGGNGWCGDLVDEHSCPCSCRSLYKERSCPANLLGTVDSLLTHTLPWTLGAMGYEGVWGSRMVLKIGPKNPLKFISRGDYILLVRLYTMKVVSKLSRVHGGGHLQPRLTFERGENPLKLACNRIINTINILTDN